MKDVTVILLLKILVVHANLMVNFDGTQHIEKPLFLQPLSSQDFKLVLTFKTVTSDGLLFLAGGVSGDYIALEIVHGKIRFVANSEGHVRNRSPTIEMFYGEEYADGNVHQIIVNIGEETEILSYDIPMRYTEKLQKKSNAKEKLKFDLDDFLYFGGQPSIKRHLNNNSNLLSSRNFEGCLNNIQFNDAFNLTESYFLSNQNSISFHGVYRPGCSIQKPNFLKSFVSSSDQLEVYSHINDNFFQAEFSYRTYMRDGVIMRSSSPNKPSSLSLTLQNNNLILNVNLTKFSPIKLYHFDSHADDGVWRRVRVTVAPKLVILRIGKVQMKYVLRNNTALDFPQKVVFGGHYLTTPSLVGCMKDIYLGEKLISIKSIMRLNPDMEYEEKQCKMKDHCLPSKPCSNNGRCAQSRDKAKCICDNTGYTGPFCQKKDKIIYKRSCDEYFQLGYRDNNIYLVKPGPSAPFYVHCDMENPSGPTTIIKTSLKNKTPVFSGNIHDKHFYYHQINYELSKLQMSDLISASKTCQQYIRYDCYNSILLDSKRNSTDYGVRWYNRNATIRRYWHGDQTTAARHSCRCGLEGNCKYPSGKCNCDSAKEYGMDDGFITDKEQLPIIKIRISRGETFSRSSFTIGSIQCFGQSATTATVKPRSNTTTVQTVEKRTRNVILIDSKLLYAIVVIVVVLIAVLLLILILKRRIFCCYYQNKAQPQIVEIYKDDVMHLNNNKNIYRNSQDLSTLNIKGEIPVSGKDTYPDSCSESSMSTNDPSRYYTHDISGYDTCSSMQSNHSAPSKRGILKIKKEIVPPPRQRYENYFNRSHGTINNSGNEPSKACLDQRGSIYFKGCSIAEEDNENVSSNNHNQNQTLQETYLDRMNNTENTQVISPLQQKILELSTSKQKLYSGELFFHQESISTVKSSSFSSSTESNINSDGDVNDTSELLPYSKGDRRKNVHFNENNGDFYWTQSANQSHSTEQLENETLISNALNKTFV